jgi:hypothetical protein
VLAPALVVALTSAVIATQVHQGLAAQVDIESKFESSSSV